MTRITSLSQLLETVSDLSSCIIIAVGADGRSTVIQQGEPVVLSDDAPKPMKTREEVEDLKVQWRGDPAWDIGDTEGFEAHRDELKAFRLELQREWDEAAERVKAERRDAAARAGGISPGHPAVDYILFLEGQLARVEKRLGEVAYGIDLSRS
ncbi:hypothetical protein [Chenggangzhangella methanolivorans]|uniref:Uncharacterized protein n=1 Tax=Chenggangzhangella methanolivorans TaxID=1437009 RepID=A0A9E6RA65_9HYPH|nr:hypothetical protein [Chenggangzhangella methanolivorans]QZO00625.1 hypothetical protein K6K41_02610 [Chenggangzhangella methanolivorans]